MTSASTHSAGPSVNDVLTAKRKRRGFTTSSKARAGEQSVKRQSGSRTACAFPSYYPPVLSGTTQGKRDVRGTAARLKKV